MRECVSYIDEQDKARVDAVATFADNVLNECRDCYREKPSPLFAYKINVHTREHAMKKMGEKLVVISNLSLVQNLLRVLNGLSNITGNEKYVEAAESAIKYHFNNLQMPNGLIQWGGHIVVDLKTLTLNVPETKNMVHELKNDFPCYELMYKVDAKATEKYIKAFWNSHITDWKNLEFNRHGNDIPFDAYIWKKEFGDPEPFRHIKGLTFLNAGNDLIYSAAMLYKLTGDKGALLWSKRLAQMYVKARHPETKLGVFQYTQPIATDTTEDDTKTTSNYGDRAKRQFGPEFGDIALEGNIILAKQAAKIYASNACMEMILAEIIGDEAREMLEWVREGLHAFAKYAYIEQTNMFRPLLADGTDLSGYILPRNGYYGATGTVMTQYQADGNYLYSFVRCARMTGDEYLWDIACKIAESMGLGYLGSAPGINTVLNMETSSYDPKALLAVLDLFGATKETQYLNLGRMIGNNILRQNFHYGYFVCSSQHQNANINTIEPYALLSLEAAIQGKSDMIPQVII